MPAIHTSRQIFQALWSTAARVVASYGFMTFLLLCPPLRGGLQLLAWQFGDLSSFLSTFEKQVHTQTVVQAVLFNTADTSAFTAAEAAHLRDVHHAFWIWSCLLAISLVANWVLEANWQASKDFDSRLVARSLQVVSVFILCSTVLIGFFFPAFFEVFHRLIFMGGNYTFPETSLLIQLFPPMFWLLVTLTIQLGVTCLLWWQAELLKKQAAGNSR